MANDYFFQEEFNQERSANTLDDTKWTYYPNTSTNFSTIQETQGNLILNQQTNTPQFPLVISKNGLPAGDFSAEIIFRYFGVTPWGTGIALSENAPTNGQDLNTLLTINVWQDQSLDNMRLSFGGQDVYTTQTNITSHIFRVDRVGLKYLIYLDNNLIYTSADTPSQVKYIWLGNPTFQNPPIPQWTVFKVDYIRVKNLAPVKTPLIFIPGIGGSELKVKDQTNWSAPNGHGGTFTNTYQAGEKVWVNQLEAIKPGEDDYFDILKMKSDGINSEANIELTGNLFPGAYQGTIDFFTQNNYTLNKDFFIFPYDWRKDLALTAPLLDQKIDSIKSQTGAQKVDIIAHSMGGLVARNYIADPQRANKVSKLIELGVPHLGSVDFLRNLRFGGCLTKVDTGPICLGIPPSEIKDTLQNMIGGFELAPSKTYFSFYTNQDSLRPYPYKNNSEVLNYNQMKNFLTNLGLNTSLFDPSENLHNIDSSLQSTNGVVTTIIAGSGVNTIGQIIEKEVFNLAGMKLNKRDILYINGDNRVPLYSASLVDSDKNYSLLGSAKIYYTKQAHGNLPNSGPGLNLVKNILGGDSNIPAGVSTQPFLLKGTQVSVHSPVNLDIYDQNNNHTGLNSNEDIEQNIPGSFYDTLDDAKFIWLPSDGVYSIRLKAIDNGSFDLKIRDFKNDINDQTILYKDVPINSSSIGQVTFDTNSAQPPIMQVDNQQISPTGIVRGNENTDTIPPEIQVIFNIQTQSLEINGIDNLGIASVSDLQTGTKLVKDLADNSSRIDFEPKSKGKKDQLSLKTITYQDSSPTTLPNNKFEVAYQNNRFTQKITIRDEEVANATFDPKTNKTKINTKLPRQKQVTDEKDGVVLLKLMTQSGDLTISY